ncbi:MAG: hypothetical protein J6W73_04015 [Verrucomicrobia bacterium]|nr:hypothetical protein [Verrucomicrobiota bacterium]
MLTDALDMSASACMSLGSGTRKSAFHSAVISFEGNAARNTSIRILLDHSKEVY